MNSTSSKNTLHYCNKHTTPTISEYDKHQYRTMNSSTTFTASNMKYHLLNLAAIASIVVAGGTAAHHLLPRQHPQAPSSFALMSSEIQQHDNECINDITMGYDECNNNEEEVGVTSSPSIAATASPQQQKQPHHGSPDLTHQAWIAKPVCCYCCC